MNQLEIAITQSLQNSPAFIELRSILRRIEKIERKIKQAKTKPFNNGYEQINTSQFKETSNPDVRV